jgi:hypothetical protein
MYGVESPTLDLDLACVLARKWRNFLMRAPLTAYLVQYGIGLDIGQIFDVFVRDASAARMDDRDHPSVLWQDCAPEVANFASFFHASELALTAAGQSPDADNPLACLYADLRRRPALIPVIYRLQWWGAAPQY